MTQETKSPPTISVEVKEDMNVGMTLTIGDQATPRQLLALAMNAVEAAVSLQKTLFAKVFADAPAPAAAEPPPEDML